MFGDLLGGSAAAAPLHGPQVPASGGSGGEPGAPAATPLRTAPGGFDYAH
jgi:hypothetical protein